MTGPHILFVTGKGGTGKSTVAAAIAVKHQQQGQKVLLIELGNQSFFGSSMDNAGHRVRQASVGGFDLLKIDPIESLKEYIKRFTLFQSTTNLLLDSKPARGIVNILPGLKELAILGKIISYLTPPAASADYDLLVVDGFATGHFLALLRAPKAMAESIASGPMGNQCRSILDSLSDPEQCSFQIIALPEELPVVESIELATALNREFGISADFICNKALPPKEYEVAAKLNPEQTEASFGSYLRQWFDRQQWSLEQLASSQTSIRQLSYCFEHDFEERLQMLAREISC